MHLMLFTSDDVKKLQSPRQFESQNSVTLMITDRTGLHSVLLQLLICTWNFLVLAVMKKGWLVSLK